MKTIIHLAISIFISQSLLAQNVGIGTENPENKLDVQADEQTDIARFRNTTSDNANISVTNGSGLVHFGLNNVGGYVGTVDAGDFRIRTNFAVRMFFNHNNGFVGIGTEDPANKLEVQAYGDSDIARFRNTTSNIANISVTNGPGLVHFGLDNEGGYVGTVDAGDFRIRTNNAVRMFFNHNNGFVGIGTLSPLNKLHVQADSGQPDIAWFGNSSQNNANINVTNGPGLVQLGLTIAGGNVGTGYEGDFRIRTNNSVRMFFNHNNGFVGIGTESPTAKLEVNGALKITDGTQGAGKILTSDATGLASWQPPPPPPPTYYPSVSICCQRWMTKNLDVATYRNGDPIPKVTSNTEWVALTTGAYCYYNNDSATYAATYGKLYNWYAVNDSRGLAPEGWHIPTDFEWTTLDTCLGGQDLGGPDLAGGPMKEIGTTHWTNPNTGANNLSGFTGLPGGLRDSWIGGQFRDVGHYGIWWSSTEHDTSEAWHRYLSYSSVSLYRIHFLKNIGYSVRCIRD